MKEEVEPTNNLAERALRFCVILWDMILRKISLESQSTWGARLIERLMTVAVTLATKVEKCVSLPNRAL